MTPAPQSPTTETNSPSTPQAARSWLDAPIRFAVHHKLIIFLLLLLCVGWGLIVAPFDWKLSGLPRAPVPIDAIPDLGENQQIVFTRWSGRSPRDVEDQITYPLTVALMGLPKLKTIRSYPYFGFSTIYVIFEEKAAFYAARTRILEKLNSLPPRTLPDGIRPRLGPDATGLGQVYWYTLEGRDQQGKATGGWSLHEIRKVQDWYVRYGLQSAAGVAEVASIGGFVQEYQIDVDPEKMRIYKVSLTDVYKAVRRTNQEVGARTIELNRVEYVVRAKGYIKSIKDIEDTVIRAKAGTPLTIRDIARVSLGPAPRRGALDKAGAEVVGGVVVARYGANPLAVLKAVKAKIKEISPGLPSKRLADGRLSTLTLVPFYDRSRLIKETLGTLEEALSLEILITILVVLLMLFHFRSSLLIAGSLPIAVLLCFVAMKCSGVDANIVALSGIAIAIGTMVDMGIVLSENILQHLKQRGPKDKASEAVIRATTEVGGAVLTAVSTTIISFLPVLTMEAAEGKLFRPLALTKTFALLAAVFTALFLLPPLAHLLLASDETKAHSQRKVQRMGFVAFGLWLGGAGLFQIWRGRSWLGVLCFLTLTAVLCYFAFLRRRPRHIRLLFVSVVAGLALWATFQGPYQQHGKLATALWLTLSQCTQFALLLLQLLVPFALGLFLLWGTAKLPQVAKQGLRAGLYLLVGLGAGYWLTAAWLPLGSTAGTVANLLFVGLLVGALLLLFWLFQGLYPSLLRFFLRHKLIFLCIPLFCLFLGLNVWLGYNKATDSWLPATLGRLGFSPQQIRSHPWSVALRHKIFPGLNTSFMPDLDEGAFLLMPTTMPHASIGEALDVLQKLDIAVSMIPEVSMVVGKLGRVDSALDPAPISMYENIIRYKAKYRLDKQGRKVRQWRAHIHTPKDIWREVVKATTLIGTTSAPFLQPISARVVMLQSGMRAPMGIKIKGPNLKTIERVAMDLEKALKRVPQISPATVIADRVVGKPYLEFHIKRDRIARYGLTIAQVQRVISMAIGGSKVTTTVEGRERYAVVIRYPRAWRTQRQALQQILIPTPNNTQIPLLQLAELRYVRGPQVLKSEDTFPIAYVIFDRKQGFGQTETVQAAARFLAQQQKNGTLTLPAGVSYTFAGNYQNQQRAEQRLSLVLPLALLLIFLLLYLQFRSVSTTFFLFSGIAVAWAGGFLMLWCYQQPWFLNTHFWGVSLREVFRVQAYDMSIAVWVGFIALFGIATDDGVVIATYLDQRFRDNVPNTIEEIRATTLEAGMRRIRPCLMTTATTLLALLPVLTSSGRGSDLMIPMAIPSFGGMWIALLTLFVVPVLYCWREERRWQQRQHQAHTHDSAPPSQTGKKTATVITLMFPLLLLGSSTHARGAAPPTNRVPPKASRKPRPTNKESTSPKARSSVRQTSPTSNQGQRAMALPQWWTRPPTQPWSKVLAHAVQHNPSLKRLRQEIKRAQTKVGKIGNWPDLQIGIQASNFPLPTFDPSLSAMTGIQYSISQRFPNLSRLRKHKAVASFAAKMAKAQLTDFRQQLAGQLRQRLYQLQYSHQAFRLQRELHVLARQMEGVVRTRYTINRAQQHEVLQIASLQTQIQQTMLSWRNQGLQQRHHLVRLGLPQRLHTRLPSPPRSPLPTPSQLHKQALQHRGGAAYWRLADQRARAMLTLAHSSYWPDVTLQIAIRQRFENRVDDGRPFLSLGVKVPIPTGGNPARRAMAQEAIAQRQWVAGRFREWRATLKQKLASQLTQLTYLHAQIRLQSQQLLPLARQRYQAALSSYRVGKADFNTLVLTLRQLFVVRLKLALLQTRRAQTHARLSALQGN